MKLTSAIVFFLFVRPCRWPKLRVQPKSAGPAAPGATKDPVATGLRMLVQRSQGNTISAIEAMPAGCLLSNPLRIRSRSRTSLPHRKFQ